MNAAEIKGPLYMNDVNDGEAQAGGVITNGYVDFVIVEIRPKIIAKITKCHCAPGVELINQAYLQDRALICNGEVLPYWKGKRPQPTLWEYQPGNMIVAEGDLFELEVV